MKANNSEILELVEQLAQLTEEIGLKLLKQHPRNILPCGKKAVVSLDFIKSEFIYE